MNATWAVAERENSATTKQLKSRSLATLGTTAVGDTSAQRDATRIALSSSIVDRHVIGPGAHLHRRHFARRAILFRHDDTNARTAVGRADVADGQLADADRVARRVETAARDPEIQRLTGISACRRRENLEHRGCLSD